MALLQTNYLKRDSIIHSLNPLVKFGWITLVIIIFLSSNSMMTFIIIDLLLIITSLIGRVGKQFIKGLLIMVLPIFVFSLIIHGVFNPIGTGSNKVFFSLIGVNFTKGGLINGLFFGFKITSIISVFYLFILTTYPGRIVASLKRIGLPHKAGFLINSTLQIVPLMLMTADTIIDAQRARGLETKGNIIKRLKSYIPLIGPIVIGSVVRVYERSIALEVRGFSAKTKKTSFYVDKLTSIDKTLIVINLLLITSYLILRVIGWQL